MLAARDLQTSKYKLLEAVLNALAAGVVLTERDAQVVYMNAAARHHIRTGRALRLVNNRFSPTDPVAARALALALSRVLDKSGAPQTLAFPDRDGAGVLATIFPLETESDGDQPFATATAAIFIQDPAVTPLFPGEAFAKLYGLTPAESRVIQAMRPGMPLHQVAHVLGIGLETVKTHLRHIFEKTDTTRQADIVALMSRATGPTKTAELPWRRFA
jgi:DNA-binding CsgD family transcriptional regulator